MDLDLKPNVQILRAGIVQTLVTGVQRAEGLALDWLSGNIYWVDAEAKKIEVARKDGKHRKVLISNNLDRPRAITLHPMNG